MNEGVFDGRVRGICSEVLGTLVFTGSEAEAGETVL